MHGWYLEQKYGGKKQIMASLQKVTSKEESSKLNIYFFSGLFMQIEINTGRRKDLLVMIK